jgi:hypothetical protein
MGRSEVGEMHGTIDANTKSEQGDHLDDKTFAEAFKPE